jgi:hypothetical protein
MGDFDFTSNEWEQGRTCSDQTELQTLVEHKSKFVRAVVAGNQHLSLEQRRTLSFDSSRGVIMWLLGNESLSKTEYDNMFERITACDFDDILYPELARSRHASIAQLVRLQSYHQWGVDIAILNNHKGRGKGEYQKLIRRYLPMEETPYDRWTEIEKLSFFRTHDVRTPSTP